MSNDELYCRAHVRLVKYLACYNHVMVSLISVSFAVNSSTLLIISCVMGLQLRLKRVRVSTCSHVNVILSYIVFGLNLFLFLGYC